MKFHNKIKLSIIFFLLSQLSFAQINKKFNGIWFANKEDIVKGDAFEGILSISSEGASFNVLDNQMYLAFNLKQKSDTLLMYYDNKNSDYGRAIFENEPPKNVQVSKDKSLFLKCVIGTENSLKIIYTNKLYVNFINKTYWNKKQKRALLFPEIFYFSKRE